MHPERWCIRFSQLLLYRYDLCSERCQRQFCDLEELLPEGDPNNGDAPEQADHQISKRHGDSKENEPDDVGQSGEDSATVANLFPEGEEGQGCKLEALQSIGNPHNGDAPEQSGCQTSKPTAKSAKYKPQYIT